MRDFHLPVEAVAALDETMPPLDDARQDYGPTGCFRDGAAFFGLAVVLFAAVAGKGTRR
ncbi:MAG TPA: hypothetical protein VFG15_30120 [Amycolatopsis sp.]|nr:hypothetical protein [Amycolatopsis sp.]